MAGSTMKARREAGVQFLQMVAGIVLIVGGLIALGYYFWAVEPGRIDEGVVSASAVVTGQRTEASGWDDSQVPQPSYLIYRESFSFLDRVGKARLGEDRVSLIFYKAHPAGSTIAVYYYPDDAAHAVIDRPSRLVRWPIPNLGMLGAMGAVAGLVMVILSRRRLLALGVGVALSRRP